MIVNTAAMTNVDACEENKVACDLLNIGVVESFKAYSEENELLLIHISTDFIFDGKKGYYKETDVANPLSYYGEVKINIRRGAEKIFSRILQFLELFVCMGRCLI
ncbi:sugar nucleotide-binding protein [Tenacibaculum maritimum]|nr:sugar nucleotide-binding protein [Tenacibaculum maritimum]